MSRILLFGNSGSGKTTLAKQLVQQRHLAHLELDNLAWMPTSPPCRKPLAESEQAISEFVASNDAWVIEGCYADLFELLLTSADEMVFLNPTEDACVENALARPFEPHKFSSPEAQQRNQEPLLQWIKQYRCRDDECSFNAHQGLFDKFTGSKREYRHTSEYFAANL